MYHIQQNFVNKNEGQYQTTPLNNV